MLHAPRERADQRLPLSHEAPQDADRVLRPEGAAEQPEGVQLLDPLAIQDVALASRHVLQPAGLDQLHLETPPFQQLEQGDPIDPGGLHGDRRHAALRQPVGDGLQVRGEGAEGPYGLRVASLRNTDEMHGGPNVDACGVEVDLLQLGRHRGGVHGQATGRLRLPGGLLRLFLRGRLPFLDLLPLGCWEPFTGLGRRGVAVVGTKDHTGSPVGWKKTTAVGAGVMRLITLPNGVAPRCQAACHQRQRQELPGPSFRTGTRHQGGKRSPRPTAVDQSKIQGRSAPRKFLTINRRPSLRSFL